MPEKDLTLKEAADILRIHYETAAMMARNGELPGAYQRTGRNGRWAVAVEPFNQWRREKAQPAPPRNATDALEPPSAASVRARKRARR